MQSNREVNIYIEMTALIMVLHVKLNWSLRLEKSLYFVELMGYPSTF